MSASICFIRQVLYFIVKIYFFFLLYVSYMSFDWVPCLPFILYFALLLTQNTDGKWSMDYDLFYNTWETVLLILNSLQRRGITVTNVSLLSKLASIASQGSCIILQSTEIHRMTTVLQRTINKLSNIEPPKFCHFPKIMALYLIFRIL